jgi:hypothetical protein
MPEGPAARGANPELAGRAERSLKDADRLLRKIPDPTPHEKARAQLEQAKVLAMLQLADAIRERRAAAAQAK